MSKAVEAGKLRSGLRPATNPFPPINRMPRYWFFPVLLSYGRVGASRSLSRCSE